MIQDALDVQHVTVLCIHLHPLFKACRCQLEGWREGVGKPRIGCFFSSQISLSWELGEGWQL
jgi:hypothetical protein